MLGIDNVGFYLQLCRIVMKLPIEPIFIRQLPAQAAGVVMGNERVQVVSESRLVIFIADLKIMYPMPLRPQRRGECAHGRE
ncbi:hypothetical protein SODG_006101 [Sodalis praecaptivus]